MKKLFSILILCSLLVYIGGYHLVYAVYQSGLKQEMKSYLKEHPDARYGSALSFKLENGAITDPSFGWEETEKEFRYHGELYDVVTIHFTSDSIRIAAIKDDRENVLETQVSEIRHNQQSRSSSAVSSVKFFSVFHIPATVAKFFPRPALVNYASLLTIIFLPPGREVTTPPPRC